MTTFHLEIECDNAAFGGNRDDCQAEIVRILRKAITDMESRGSVALYLRDTNGNQVGTCYLDYRDEIGSLHDMHERDP